MAKYGITSYTSYLFIIGFGFFSIGVLMVVITGPWYAVSNDKNHIFDKTTCIVESTSLLTEICEWCDDSICHDECTTDNYGDVTCYQVCPCEDNIYTCYKVQWVITYLTEHVENCDTENGIGNAIIKGNFHQSSGFDASEQSRRSAQKELDKYPDGYTGSCFINSTKCEEGRWILTNPEKENLLIALISGGVIAGLGIFIGIGILIYIQLYGKRVTMPNSQINTTVPNAPFAPQHEVPSESYHH